jgi:hypothetical protein
MVQELFDELHGSKFFSKLDWRFGFYQIRIKNKDIPNDIFWVYQYPIHILRTYE